MPARLGRLREIDERDLRAHWPVLHLRDPIRLFYLRGPVILQFDLPSAADVHRHARTNVANLGVAPLLVPAPMEWNGPLHTVFNLPLAALPEHLARVLEVALALEVNEPLGGAHIFVGILLVLVLEPAVEHRPAQ